MAIEMFAQTLKTNMSVEGYSIPFSITLVSLWAGFLKIHVGAQSNIQSPPEACSCTF